MEPNVSLCSGALMVFYINLFQRRDDRDKQASKTAVMHSSVLRGFQISCIAPCAGDSISLVGRTIVSCCQVTMIWCAADPNFITPVFVVSVGSIAGIFGMLDIMTEVWFIVEHLYE